MVTGPSGVGKSTLVREAVRVIDGLSFSVSATTRTPRSGETHGVDYTFLSPDVFFDLVQSGAFLEHATVYGRSYGTLLEPTVQAIQDGRSLLLDIDIAGSKQVRSAWPEAIHIALLPPSIDALAVRLRERRTDSEAVIATRMSQVGQQLAELHTFDYVVLNDDLHTAHAVFQGILFAELSRTARRGQLVTQMESELSRWNTKYGSPATGKP